MQKLWKCQNDVVRMPADYLTISLEYAPEDTSDQVTHMFGF